LEHFFYLFRFTLSHPNVKHFFLFSHHLRLLFYTLSGFAVTGLYNHPLATASLIPVRSAILGIIDITTLLLPAVTISNKNQKQKQEQ
jgi:hypothetical protein